MPERMSDALGALPCVMFAPTDVELVAGAPSARRRYLDILLALTSRGYLSALQRYRAALSHRNAALRAAARSGASGQSHDARIAVWEAPLSEYGAVLWGARVEWVLHVADRFSALCDAIGERAPVHMRYLSSLDEDAHARQALARALESQRAHDIRRGLTHAGPHRDDLGLTMDMDGARDLRTFGSAGQQRTAAIAMRVLEAETFRERRGLRPLFLLDDPFAELDVRRAARIVELLENEGLGQTVLAVPRESDIPRGLGELARLRIRDGSLEPWSAKA
jgi:DNA replication and repair protein RecF